MLSRVWKESLPIALPVLKKAWGWLLFSMILEEVLSFAVSRLRENEQLYIFGAIFVVLFQLLLSAIGVIIINQMIYDVRTGTSLTIRQGLRQNLKYVFIESTRAILPVLLKCLLLLIPGIVEGIRLYFVPYVAQLNKEYRAGQVDALERSRAIVRGRFLSVTGILILAVVFSMVPRFYLESIDVLKRPAFYALIFFVSMVVELYGDIVTFMTYIHLEELHGNSVSLS